MSKTLSKQTSSEWFWGADAGFQVDVLLPQSASGACMQMVVQNIEQTNFLRVLLGCGCRVFKLMYCFLRVLRGCVCRWLSKTLSKQTSSECFWGADAGFQVDVLLPQSASGCVCRWLSKTLSKQTSSECFWGADAGFQVDVLLPQSASGVCMQMVVQNIEQTNFLRVLLGCGCRVSS